MTRSQFERLFRASQCFPHLRLGQLIASATQGAPTDIFYIDDETLVDIVENYIKTNTISISKGD